MCQISVGVFGIRQRDLVQRGLFTGDDFHQRLRSVQQRATQFGKTHIAPAGDHVVSHPHNFLLIHLVADLGATEHNPDVRPLLLEQSHHFARLRDVPDVHTKTDDLHTFHLKQFGDHVLCVARNRELAQRRLRAQVTHVRQQVAQAQRRVDVFRVQGAQDDGGHPGIIEA